MSRGESGSVLIEALVACAIVAMLLGMTYQTIAGSAARARAADASRGALLTAQSVMAGVGSETPLIPGGSGGAQGDLVWQVEIGRYQSGFAGSAAGGLYSVSVEVRRRESQRVLASLHSLRVGPA